jgi:hypothetical protein
MLVNELSDGVEIDQVLLVREVERRPRRDGGEYLRLALGDRTGSVVCMVWEELDDVAALARAGEPVHVSGRYTVHPRFGPQINLRGLTPALDGSYSADDLRAGPARSVEQMEREIRELIATVQQPQLRTLLARVFGERSDLWQGSASRPPPSTTTRPTATACSSTRCRSPRRSVRSAPRSRASTATWPSPARCCTTSASSTPTPASATRSSSPTPAGCRARSRSATTASAA